MNSNNLELSLIENEIEKISSKYQLPCGNANAKPQVQIISQAASQPNLMLHPEGLIAQAVKSPSVVTFGGTIISQSSQQSYPQPNVLQELTLNKQGKVPVSKDQKPGKGGMPQLNPKDLSNEELEYIIKTGKLPTKYANEQPNQQLQQQPQPQRMPIPSSQQQMSMQQQQQMVRTSTNHQQLQFVMQQQQQQQQQQHYDKENQQNYMDLQIMAASNPILMKNYNSPRSMTDFLVPKQTATTSAFSFPITSQPVQLPTPQAQNSFQLDNSTYSKAGFDQSQISTSQAASQAMKALQDRVKQMELEKQLVEDKLSVSEAQNSDTIKKLQHKLKEETDKSYTREEQLREEMTILKRQVELVEAEKLRHLEQNSSERDQWRQQYKMLEEDNINLKKQLSEYAERYSGIEDCIQDIKRREAQLRDKYEQELRSEKERNHQMESDIDNYKERYEELKSKIKQKNKELEQENFEMKEELRKMREDKTKEVGKLNRECDKWKRESQMLKEELSIIGSVHQQQKEEKREKQASKKGISNLKESKSCPGGGIKASTPRAAAHEKSCSKKRCCHSPSSTTRQQKDVKNKTQEINHSGSVSQFQSIDSQIQAVAVPTSAMQSTKKKSKSRERINHQTTSSAAKVRSACEQQIMSTSRSRQEKKGHRRQESSEKVSSESKQHIKHSASSKYKENRPQKSAKAHHKRSESRGKHNHHSDQSGTKPASERSLNGVQSQQNLISINTKMGQAENVDDQGRNSHQSSEYILIDGSQSSQLQTTQSQAQRGQTQNNGGCLNDSSYMGAQQQLLQQQTNKFNQYKRNSADTSISNQFGFSQTSDINSGLLYSHQSSIDNQGSCNTAFNKRSALDIGELNSQNPIAERHSVDNEIFYLEREIFDYNQQYKSLLSQQSSSSSQSYQLSSTNSGNEGANLNSKLRQIAQMLEEKSERLFDLKKQQQQIILKESYREKNPFLESTGRSAAATTNTSQLNVLQSDY